MKKFLAPVIHESFPKRSRIYFRIEKVIKRKNIKALVKWVGYSDKHTSWVPFSDLISNINGRKIIKIRNEIL